ncbi:MAG: MFS transporter [Candidatus Tectomicrobia bacterium]
MNKHAAGSTRTATDAASDVAHLPRLRFIAALYNRDFRYLWAVQLFAAFVQRMGDVVLGWLVLEITRSPFLVGVVIAMRRVGTLLGPWAGVVADRVDRRRLALVLSVLMLITVLGLAVLVYTRQLEVWHLFASSIITSMLGAFYQPVQQSLQADILAPRDLTNGITLSNMAMNITSIGGPAVAGLLLACCRPARTVREWSEADMVLSLNWFTYNPSRQYITTSQGNVLSSNDHGLSWVSALFRLPDGVVGMLELDGAATGVLWAFVLMVALHTLQLGCYIMMRPIQPGRTRRHDNKAIGQNLREGLHYSRREAGLWTALVLAGLVNFVGLPLQSTLLPVFAREVFSVNATGLGWLGATAGAGALLGSMAMIRLASMQRAGQIMVWGTFAWSLFVLLFAFIPRYELAVVILGVIGITQTLSLTNMTIMLLNTSAADMRGRIMGLRSLAVAPHFLGGLLSGVVAEHFGAPQAAMACGVVGMVVTLAVAPWVPKSDPQ